MLAGVEERFNVFGERLCTSEHTVDGGTVSNTSDILCSPKWFTFFTCCQLWGCVSACDSEEL